jgi:choline dehydrogenase-like flavoprotein
MRPVAHNRVVPTAERDAFGLPRLAARCVLDAGDHRNAEDTLRALGETLLRLDRGRVRVNNDRIYRQVDGQGHTLGTTRMGHDAATSVVDGDCRVHGYSNLFVAGSSVFPSGGYANPTITIVALALRLADHLAGKATT